MVIKRGQHMSGERRPPQGKFTGDAEQRPLHEQPDAIGVRVSFVRFQPGARTHWHSHSGGQVLHVVEGDGLTQVEGGLIEQLAAGDTSVTVPGKRHWHGAGSGGPMAHLAVTIGELSWSDDALPEVP